MWYNQDLIREFTIGRVVRNVSLDETSLWVPGKGDPRDIIGHVIGFGKNSTDEVLIKVRFADGSETDIHPSNLMII